LCPRLTLPLFESDLEALRTYFTYLKASLRASIFGYRDGKVYFFLQTLNFKKEKKI